MSKQNNINPSLPQSPLVSICCVTYNHAPFIRKCLEGFLMQKVNLDALPCREEYEVGYEILIHDDCSTDGTTEIVKEYAEKYPDKIFPLYETENQFCKPGRESMDFFNYRRAKGKYIAICEGDDYWTDPLKLQKQVEFMEANEEYSVCWHQSDFYYVDTDKLVHPQLKDGGVEDYDVTPMEFLHGRGGQPLSLVFRRDKFDYSWSKHYTKYLDSMEIYHLLRTGKGRMMVFNGGQYNLHQGGICTSMKDLYRGKESCRDFMEMYVYTKDRELLSEIHKNILWFFDLCHQNRDYSLWKEAMGYMYHLAPMMGLKYTLIFLKQWLKWTIKKI